MSWIGHPATSISIFRLCSLFLGGGCLQLTTGGTEVTARLTAARPLCEKEFCSKNKKKLGLSITELDRRWSFSNLCSKVRLQDELVLRPTLTAIL
jgi:hypothetical protein